MAKLVSKRYGDALFDLAVEENRVEDMSTEVTQIREIFADHPELTGLIINPGIPKEEKLEMLERIFKDQASEDMIGFLRILVSKQRFGELSAILDYFTARAKEYQKIGMATVTSPAELSGEWKSKIEKRLLETSGYTSMEMSWEVKPEIIGGLIIRIGDTVVDSSISGKLEDLKKTLI